MRYFDAQTLAFLRDLRKHNDRAWFAENKDRYEESVKEPFLRFISDVGPELRKISPQLVADPQSVGASMLRIYRDVRFSKDKSPYKTHVVAQFRLGDKRLYGPVYYLYLEPENCFVGGGMWRPEPANLRKIRERISAEPVEWKKAGANLDHPEDALTHAPRGFDPDDPMINDIKRKSFTSSVKLTDAQITRPDLVKTFVRSCEQIEPLMKFLAASVGAKW